MEGFKNRYNPTVPYEQLDSNSPERTDGMVSFSGVDCSVYIFLPGLYPDRKRDLNAAASELTKSSYRKLGSLKFISWGSQRAKVMVTSLGKVTGTGYTRGARVITGVMVFNQLDRSAFMPLQKSRKSSYTGPYKHTTLPDELPPFDLLLSFVNERGHASFMIIKHIEIVQIQGTNSIEEVVPSLSYSFVALEISEMIPLTESRPAPPEQEETGSLGLGDDERLITRSGFSNNSNLSVETSLNNPFSAFSAGDFNIIDKPARSYQHTPEEVEKDISRLPASIPSTVTTTNVGNVVPPSGKTFPDR